MENEEKETNKKSCKYFVIFCDFKNPNLNDLLSHKDLIEPTFIEFAFSQKNFQEICLFWTFQLNLFHIKLTLKI